MTIGILSMQRIFNHGSFWQAYMLKDMLTKMGHNVEFIDIIPGKCVSKRTKPKFKLLRPQRVFNKLIFEPKKRQIIESAQRTYLGCTALNYRTDYDRIIIGSDEVFNFAQISPWGFSTQLFGAISNDHVSTYAASFGSTSYEDIEKYRIKNELVTSISNLKNISVRDKNSYQIIKRLLPRADTYQHMDPVLIGDLPVPERQVSRQKYIAIYAYSFRLNNPEYIKAIIAFSHKYDYKIYSIGFYQTWVDKNINVDPFELLQYFVNAEYVITDTFHGTIFSIKCHKKFATIICEGIGGNHAKLTSLLEGVNLNERLLTKATALEEILTAKINYQQVDEILSKERERANEYLQLCINGEG